MKIMRLLFVTSNANKLREARRLLGFSIGHSGLELDELQSIDTGLVARHKALQAYNRLRTPVIVEDTGLYIDGLNGFPGALVKWAVRGLGYEGLCRIVDRCPNRKAYAQTCIAFCDGKRVRLFNGRINGTIAMHPKGKRNFGWDYIFIPKGRRKTFAEMSIGEKNVISMRRKAFDRLRRFLAEKNIA